MVSTNQFVHLIHELWTALDHIWTVLDHIWTVLARSSENSLCTLLMNTLISFIVAFLSMWIEVDAQLPVHEHEYVLTVVDRTQVEETDFMLHAG